MQHRRVKHPESYTLSVDLFGPLQVHVRGRDEESVSANPHIKYGLVGAFRVPKSVVGISHQDKGKEAFHLAEANDHLSDYEPSEPGDRIQLPLPEHDTLGEVSQEMFEELFGETDPLDLHTSAVDASGGDSDGIPPFVCPPWGDVLPEDDDALLDYVDELKTPVEPVLCWAEV